MPKAPMPDSETWTLLRLVRWTTGYFQDHGIESARSEAEILLAHCLGVRRIDLYLNHDKPLTEAELGNFKTLIKRRISREPLAYITGSREFWSLLLAVGPSVLIPRPETECLVEAVLPVLDDPAGKPKRVLDLGTGCGSYYHCAGPRASGAPLRGHGPVPGGPGDRQAKCPHPPGGSLHQLVLRQLGCGPGA